MNPTRRLLLAASAAIALGVVTGRALAAETVLESRPVAAFERIRMDGPGDLIVRQAPRHAVVIEAEPRLIRRIRVIVRDGELSFELGPQPFRTEAPLRFFVSTPDLRALACLGSGNVHVEALRGERFELHAAGSGDILLEHLQQRELQVFGEGAGDLRIEGESAVLRVVAGDSGDLDLSGLHTRQAAIEHGGSGDVEVNVREALDARLQGAGDLIVHGSPRIRQRQSGIGELLTRR